MYFDDEDYKPKKKKLTKNAKSRKLSFQELDSDNISDKFYYKYENKRFKKTVQ